MSGIDLGIVKSNIGRMIDAGAPESDIDGYIASEGVTTDMLKAHSAAPAPVAAPEMTFDAMGNPTGVTAAAAPAPTMPYGEQMAKVGSGLNAGVRAAADRGTFGQADRIAAAMGAATGVGGTFGDYSGNLAAQQAETKQDAVDHPVATTTGGLAGALATGVGLMKAGVTAAPRVMDLVSGITPAARAAATAGEAMLPQAGLAARVAGIGADGAAFGAADRAGHAATLADVPSEAAHGAVEGGFVGGALPLIGSAVAGTYRAVAPFVSPAVEGIGRGANAALDSVVNTLTPAKLRQLGPAGSIGDTSSSAEALMQGARGRGGAPRDTIDGFLDNRHLGQADRVEEALDANMGRAQNPAAVSQAISDTGEAVTAPILRRADALPAPTGPAMDEVLGRPAVAAGLREASVNAANEGRPLQTVMRDAATGDVVPDAAAAQWADGSRQRIGQAVRDLMTPAGGRLGEQLGTRDAAIASRSAAASDLYNAGRAATIDYGTPEGQALVDLYARIPAAARSSAFRMMKAEGVLPEAANADAMASLPIHLAPGAAPAAPVSLSTFVTRNGGLTPTADLESMGLRGLTRQSGGRDVDMMREAAAEAGYLPHDSTPNDFLELLDRNARGEKVYPMGETARARGVDPHAEGAARDAHAAAYGDVIKGQIQAGTDLRAIDPDVASSAAHRMAFGRETDPVRAYELARADAEAAARSPSTAPDAGSTLDTTQLTPAFWQKVGQGLGKTIQENTVLGRVNPEGYSYSVLKRDLDDALRSAVPDLKAGDAAFADHSGPINALERGYAAMKDGTPVEVIRRDLAPLGEVEREHYATGAGNFLLDKLGRSRANDLAHTMVGDQATMDKLGAIMADRPDRLAAFQQAIGNEGRSFDEALQPDTRALRGAHEVVQAQAARLGDTTAGKAADEARAAIEAQLSASNPEFAAAIARRQDYRRLHGSVDQGRDALGADQPWPDSWRATSEAASPAERSGHQVGMRGEMQEALRGGGGNQPVPSVSRVIGKPGSFNRENVETTFGADPTKAVADRLDAEAVMVKTRNRVAYGSNTQDKQEALHLLDDASVFSRVPASATLFGGAAHIAQKAGGAVLRGITGRAADATRNDIANVFTADPELRDRVVAAILDAQAGSAARSDQIRSMIGNSGTAAAAQQADPVDRFRGRPARAPFALSGR